MRILNPLKFNKFVGAMVLSTARARGSRATKCFSRPHLGEKRIILPRLDDSKTTGYFSNYAPSDGNASPRRMFRMTVRVLRSIRFRNCHVVRIETRFGVRGWDAVQIFPQKSQRNPLARSHQCAHFLHVLQSQKEHVA